MNQSSNIFLGLIVTGLMLSVLAHHSAFGQFSSPPITATAPRIEYVQFWLYPTTPAPQNQTTTATATNQSTTTRTADNCALTYVYCEGEPVRTPPPTLAPRPSPPQQPPTTTPPPPTTTTPPPPTAGTTTATTDPELQRFDQIANGCKATIQRLYPGAQTSDDVFFVQPQGATSADFSQMAQCSLLLNQAIDQYCNILQTYDAAKCAYVKSPEIVTLLGMTMIIAESDFLYSPEGLAGNLPLLGGGQ